MLRRPWTVCAVVALIAAGVVGAFGAAAGLLLAAAALAGGRWGLIPGTAGAGLWLLQAAVDRQRR